MRHPDKSSSTVGAQQVSVSGALMWWGLFYLVSFLFVWLRVDPALRYHHSAPGFLMQGSFFAKFAFYPGGLLDYAGSFLAQADFHGWLGAWISSSLVTASALLVALLVGRPGASAPIALVLPTALLALYLTGGYSYPSATVPLGLLVALLAVWMYPMWIFKASPLVRIAACWALSLLLFYLAGTWWFVWTVTLCALVEFLKQRVLWIAGACLAAILCQPLFGIVFPAIPIEANVPAPGISRWAFWALLGSTPLAVLVAAFLVGKEISLAEPTPRRTKARAQTRGMASVLQPMPLMLLGAVFVAVWFSVDELKKSRIQVSYHASRDEWERSIAAASSCPRLDYVGGIQLVRALDHAGRLPEDLMNFAWPERLELFPGFDSGLDCLPAQSEALLEIGQVNLAEHYAHEALELQGERPGLLLLLAKVNVLKDRPQAARIFLHSLSTVPFWKAPAEEALRALDNGGSTPPSWKLDEIKPFLPATDDPSGAVNSEDALRLVLKGKSTNRRALNYLLAHWLLTRQPERILANLHQLAEAGYTALPRPCEEALLPTSKKKEAPAPDLQGFSIRPETTERFAKLWERLQQGGVDQATLARDYAGTYWLYSLSREAREGGGRP